MTILKNSNWSKTNKKNILSDKNIDPKRLSFKFYEENMFKNQNHLFLTYQQEKKKIYFHAVSYKKKGLFFLDSSYSGFIIPNPSLNYYLNNSNEINKKLTDYLNLLKFNVLIIQPNPYSIYSNDISIPHQYLFKGHKVINGFLIIEKNNFDIKSYNLRREIKIGLKNISNYRIITEKNDDCFSYLKKILDKNIKQKIDLNFLEKIYENSQKGLYKISILLNNSDIICVLIFSNTSRMSSQTYNYSSDQYKKEFLNKGLHYLTIKSLFDNNLIDFFLFGDSIDKSDGMEQVTKFKQSFCNKSLIANKIYVPLNIFGRLYQLFKIVKN